MSCLSGCVLCTVQRQAGNRMSCCLESPGRKWKISNHAMAFRALSLPHLPGGLVTAEPIIRKTITPSGRGRRVRATVFLAKVANQLSSRRGRPTGKVTMYVPTRPKAHRTWGFLQRWRQACKLSLPIYRIQTRCQIRIRDYVVPERRSHHRFGVPLRRGLYHFPTRNRARSSPGKK